MFVLFTCYLRDIKELFFDSEVPDSIYFSAPKFKKLSKNRDFGNILAPGCVLVDHLLSQKLVLTFLKLTVFLESVWALLSENTSYFVGWVNMGHILAYLCVGGLGWWEGDFLCECMAHFEMANLKSQKKRTFQVCW